MSTTTWRRTDRNGSAEAEAPSAPRPGLGLGIAVGVVLARLASVLVGVTTVLTAQWLLVGLAGTAIVIGRSEQRSARSSSERRLAALARRVGGMQLAIGAVLMVVTVQAPHLIEGVTDWISV